MKPHGSRRSTHILVQPRLGRLMMTKHMPDVTAMDKAEVLWEIRAIRYGTNQRRTRGENFILEKQPAEIMPMDFYCWVLRSSDRVIVVDTGMDADKAARHG